MRRPASCPFVRLLSSCFDVPPKSSRSSMADGNNSTCRPGLRSPSCNVGTKHQATTGFGRRRPWSPCLESSGCTAAIVCPITTCHSIAATSTRGTATRASTAASGFPRRSFRSITFSPSHVVARTVGRISCAPACDAMREKETRHHEKPGWRSCGHHGGQRPVRTVRSGCDAVTTKHGRSF